jgi:hypothetical protein
LFPESAVRVVHERQCRVGKETANQFALCLDHVAVSLFALSQRPFGAPPVRPLHEESCDERHLSDKHRGRAYDVLLVVIPEARRLAGRRGSRLRAGHGRKRQRHTDRHQDGQTDDRLHVHIRTRQTAGYLHFTEGASTTAGAVWGGYSAVCQKKHL